MQRMMIGEVLVNFTRRKRQAAAELLAELESDPKYLAMRAEKERKQKAFKKLLTEDERNLIAELAEVGVHVSSVWDLVNTSEPYPTAIPVLLRHLQTDHHKRTREGIRALIVPESRGIATELILLFKRLDAPEDNDFKWVLAQAIVASATVESVDKIITMARNKRHGIARGPLLHTLCLLNKKKAKSILSEFVKDQDTKTDAKEVLKLLRN